MKRPCFKLELPFPQPLAGVDEAGCAPLAGQVVAAAVVLDRERFPRGIDDSKKLESLADIGMRDGLQKILKSWLAREKGLIVFSAPTGAGLRTTWRAGLQAADRLIRDFVMVRDEAAPKEDEIINVDAKTYDATKGETATKLIADLLLKQPDVMVVPDVKDADTFAMMVGMIRFDRKIAEEHVLMFDRRSRRMLDPVHCARHGHSRKHEAERDAEHRD